MKVLIIGLILVGASCSSEKDDKKPDIGVTDQGGGDAGGSDTSKEPDKDLSDSCLTAHVDEAFTLFGDDDVSIEIKSTLGEKVSGQYGTFRILFERHLDGPDTGSFDLSADLDSNFGNCSHCVLVVGTDPKKILYAQSGILTNAIDPYTRQMDIEIKNLKLVESTVDPMTRQSSPVEGGICVRFADFSVKEKFQPGGWLCGADKYIDGQFCDCQCGALDPDCANQRYCRPGGGDCPDPLPVRGCEAEQMCKHDPVTMVPRCVSSCDWEMKTPCDSGVCIFDDGDGTQCISASERLAPQVQFGEACPRTNLQIYCNIENGFALGYCDTATAANICRPLCTTDDECPAAGEMCRHFTGAQGLGYCGPEPEDF